MHDVDVWGEVVLLLISVGIPNELRVICGRGRVELALASFPAYHTTELMSRIEFIITNHSDLSTLISHGELR